MLFLRPHHLRIDSYTSSKFVPPKCFYCCDEQTAAGILSDDWSSTPSPLINTFVSKSDAVFARPAPRPNQKARSSLQFDGKVSLPSTYSTASFSHTTVPNDGNLRASPSATFEVASGIKLQRGDDSEAAASDHTLSAGTVSSRISRIGTKVIDSLRYSMGEFPYFLGYCKAYFVGYSMA